MAQPTPCEVTLRQSPIFLCIRQGVKNLANELSELKESGGGVEEIQRVSQLPASVPTRPTRSCCAAKHFTTLWRNETNPWHRS